MRHGLKERLSPAPPRAMQAEQHALPGGGAADKLIWRLLSLAPWRRR